MALIAVIVACVEEVFLDLPQCQPLQKNHRRKWSIVGSEIPQQWLLDLCLSATNKQLTIPQVQSFMPWENPYSKVTLTLHKTPNRASRSVVVKCPWFSASDTLQQHPGFSRFQAPSRGRSPPEDKTSSLPRRGEGLVTGTLATNS